MQYTNTPLDACADGRSLYLTNTPLEHIAGIKHLQYNYTMTTLQQAAMQQALEALETCSETNYSDEGRRQYFDGWMTDRAITSLCQALEAEQQVSPVYQMQRADGSWVDQDKQAFDYNASHGWPTRILYTQPLTHPSAAAVINAARIAMDESCEAFNEAMDISIPAHLAAALSLRLDEYDDAIQRAHKIGV